MQADSPPQRTPAKVATSEPSGASGESLAEPAPPKPSTLVQEPSAAAPPLPTPAEAPEPGSGPLVDVSPFGADPLGGAAEQAGDLRFEAGYVLRSADWRFGGFSGIWIDPEGARLILVSDRGTFWRARPEHRADDRLTGITDWQVVEPERLEGDPGGRYGGDAEALAGDPPGGLAVAYESAQRLRRFAIDDLHAAPSRLARPDELAEPSNAGIEALAPLADGSLLAIAEGIYDDDGDHAAWLIAGEHVERLAYRSASGYLPTGADRLDDVIYVLERRFSWFGGFSARIVALPADQVEPGATLVGRELTRLQSLVAENFEGIAARRARDGRVLLYLVSDDNFLALQQTLLLQLSVDDRALAGRGLGEDVRLAHEGAERQQ